MTKEVLVLCNRKVYPPGKQGPLMEGFMWQVKVLWFDSVGSKRGVIVFS